METSALQKINIEKAFETLIAEIHKKFLNNLKDDDYEDYDKFSLEKENVVDLNSSNKKTIFKKCCSSI
jgi:hypothetical protein